MIIRGKEIARRTIGLILGVLLIVGLASFGLYQCDQRRNEAAQGNVDSAQAGAQQNSAADAIETVSRTGEREGRSEELTRTNEREIRAADGAGERVKPGVDYAGRKALCQREAYRKTEDCKIFRKEP